MLLTGLLTHPEQLAAVRDDRSLVGSAIEEALRWDGPVLASSRLATADVSSTACRIPAGAFVDLLYGAANHDPEVFPDPEAFDVFRAKHRHFGFAFGAHNCLGQQLARLELARALNAVLDELPDVRLDPDFPTPRREARTCGRLGSSTSSTGRDRTMTALPYSTRFVGQAHRPQGGRAVPHRTRAIRRRHRSRARCTSRSPAATLLARHHRVDRHPAAAAMPGVTAVYVAADLNHLARLPASTARPLAHRRAVFRVLADGDVRCVGEPIAMVVADSRYLRRGRRRRRSRSTSTRCRRCRIASDALDADAPIVHPE